LHDIHVGVCSYHITYVLEINYYYIIMYNINTDFYNFLLILKILYIHFSSNEILSDAVVSIVIVQESRLLLLMSHSPFLVLDELIILLSCKETTIQTVEGQFF
jgi:hypothetical protein